MFYKYDIDPPFVYYMFDLMDYKYKKKNTPDGTRTQNRLIRSQTPYPLGHKRLIINNFMFYNYDIDPPFVEKIIYF